MLNNNGSSSWI